MSSLREALAAKRPPPPPKRPEWVLRAEQRRLPVKEWSR